MFFRLLLPFALGCNPALDRPAPPKARVHHRVSQPQDAAKAVVLPPPSGAEPQVAPQPKPILIADARPVTEVPAVALKAPARNIEEEPPPSDRPIVIADAAKPPAQPPNIKKARQDKGSKAQPAAPPPAKTEVKAEAAKPAEKPAAPPAEKPAEKKPEKVTLPSAPPVESKPKALALAPAAGADLSKCVSCHSVLTADRKPHNPLKEGTCDACHVASPGSVGKCRSPQGTAWKLVAGQPALCQKCHDTSGAGKPHPVIKSQGCTACHDPHASKLPTLLRITPIDALCYKCHSKFDDAEFIHTPIKQGKCLGCHNPHQGDANPLLVDQREALCLSCHKKPDLVKVHGNHAPFVENRCLECHDPHRSDVKGQLVESGKKFCLGCHDSAAKPGPAIASKKFRIDLTKKVVHKAVSGGNCQDCHSASGPLTKPITEVCFKCHTRFDELYKFQHGAAKLGDCVVCHDPHSSANKAMLVSARINDVCFTCHTDDATKRPWVHKPILEKGCTACHDPHGGDYKGNFADAEPPALCLSCHKNVKVEVKKPHKALERYGCLACHDPHASNNDRGLVKASVNELCISCHQDHPDGSHTGGPHKVEGGADPKRKNRPFSCASCHNPHGSDNPKLFYAGATPQDACKYCHGNAVATRSPP